VLFLKFGIFRDEIIPRLADATELEEEFYRDPA
jgi:hypothetical protein